jgi:hypothetical protein
MGGEILPGPGFMKRSEQNRWATARTLGEMGELTALWLEGELEQTPTHAGPPAEETKPLIQVLAAMNRTGAVTVTSQPGCDEMIDGSRWLQRAGVDVLTSHELADALSSAAARRGLSVIRYGAPPAAMDYYYATEALVTLDGEEPCTWFGRAMAVSDLLQMYEGCSPELLAALCEAEQLTLVEPEWGPSNRLWELLGALKEWQPRKDHNR